MVDWLFIGTGRTGAEGSSLRMCLSDIAEDGLVRQRVVGAGGADGMREGERERQAVRGRKECNVFLRVWAMSCRRRNEMTT